MDIWIIKNASKHNYEQIYNKINGKMNKKIVKFAVLDTYREVEQISLNIKIITSSQAHEIK